MAEILYNKTLSNYIEIDLPGSKSEANRVLMIRELCKTPFQINNLPDVEDTRVMQKSLQQINQYALSQEFGIEAQKIDCGNTGTALRFLTALLSIIPGIWLLEGNERMKKRPIGPMVQALQSLGAHIDYVDNQGFPPLRIAGHRIKGGSCKIDASLSSQFISGLMMIAPLTQKGIQLEFSEKTVSFPYLEMTSKVMKYFGVDVSLSAIGVQIPHGKYVSKRCFIEKDWSSVAFFYNLLSVMPEKEFFFPGLSLSALQGDEKVAEVFLSMGIITDKRDDGICIQKIKTVLVPLSLDCSSFPDMVPALVVSCALQDIECRFFNVGHLALKESDRLKSLEINLGNAGYNVRAGKDFIEVGKRKDEIEMEVHIQCFDDHRIAMALAALAVKHEKVFMDNPYCVSKSFPTFWNELEKAGYRVIL